MHSKKSLSPLVPEPNLFMKLAAAGIGASTAEFLTFPLDMAKVRLMVQGEGVTGASFRYHGVFGTIRTVAKNEGIVGLYTGLTAGIHRQLVIGAVRIGLYDNIKSFLSIHIDGSNDIHHTSVITRISSAITAGLIAVSVGQPTDVVKVRMQAQGASGTVRYRTALSAYGKIGRQEGIRGLWKGLTPNAARTCIVNVSEIVSYDLIKSTILKHNLMSDSMPCHFLSAVGAGFVTTAVCCPVDVIKTRFTNSSPGQYRGIIHCTVNTWMEKGAATFYKGCIPNFLRLTSWNIAMFVTYEQVKRLLVSASRFDD